MALGGEVVDLGRPDLLHQPDQVGRVRHVAIVHQERHVTGMRIFIEMIDPRGVERRRAPLDAVHGVAEPEQIFGQIGAVLSGNAGDQRDALWVFCRHVFSSRSPGLPETRGAGNSIRFPLSLMPKADWNQADSRTA
jgi:hypothetical protein